MKKWFLHILLLAGLFGTLTTSCSQEEAVELSGTTNGTVRIQFTLDLDGNADSRAAAWNDITGNETDNEDGDVRKVGSVYENTISLEHFQVFLFQNNAFLGEVGSLSLVDVASGTINKNKYTFRGEVTVHNATVTNNMLQNATIMVVANYEGYVNGNLAVTQNYIFDYIADNYRPTGNVASSYIPMWGMLTTAIPLNESTDDTFTPIGDIYMLRSLAKIEVLMAANDFTLEGAKLNRYNSKVKLLPSKPANGYFSATSTSDYGTEDCMNDEVSAVTSELSFFETSTGSYVIYVPEYNNDSKDIEITLDIAKDGKSISGDLDSEGKFKLATSSIVRNHWYKCTVNSVDYNTGFDLTLAVAPWTDVKETFSYESDLSYNDGSWTNYASIGDTDTGKTIVLRPGSNANVNTTAEYSFEINTPLTIEWMAVLEDPSMKFEFDMAKTSGTGTVTGENAVQRTVKGELLVTGSQLTLGVKAIDPNESGQYEAKLRVYVTYEGKTIELDLTDGEETALNHFTIQHSKL